MAERLHNVTILNRKFAVYPLLGEKGANQLNRRLQAAKKRIISTFNKIVENMYRGEKQIGLGKLQGNFAQSSNSPVYG